MAGRSARRRRASDRTRRVFDQPRCRVGHRERGSRRYRPANPRWCTTMTARVRCVTRFDCLGPSGSVVAQSTLCEHRRFADVTANVGRRDETQDVRRPRRPDRGRARARLHAAPWCTKWLRRPNPRRTDPRPLLRTPRTRGTCANPPGGTASGAARPRFASHGCITGSSSSSPPHDARGSDDSRSPCAPLDDVAAAPRAIDGSLESRGLLTRRGGRSRRRDRSPRSEHARIPARVGAHYSMSARSKFVSVVSLPCER